MNQLVVLGVIILTVLAGRGSALECYVCSSSTDETFSEKNNAADVKTKCTDLATTTTDTTFDHCFIAYTTSSSGDTVIIRGGGAGNATVSCTRGVQATINGIPYSVSDGSTCTCNTDKCNSQVVDVKTTFECYECTSADYFDNGCGKELKETEYVHKVKGCSACGKTVTVNKNYFTSYSRGCVRAAEVEDECFGDETQGKLCVCQSDHCNSAQALHVTAFSIISALILLIAKLYC